MIVQQPRESAARQDLALPGEQVREACRGQRSPRSRRSNPSTPHLSAGREVRCSLSMQVVQVKRVDKFGADRLVWLASRLDFGGPLCHVPSVQVAPNGLLQEVSRAVGLSALRVSDQMCLRAARSHVPAWCCPHRTSYSVECSCPAENLYRC